MKRSIAIPVDSVVLEGNLVVPAHSRGLVLFVHGSGSSRFSPRNVFVAETLEKEGIATLLIDLLTEEEDEVYENRFNIALLTNRLIAVTRWLEENKETGGLALGFFGASTGAAAALFAAAQKGSRVQAVVSRGGRPDLATPILDHIVSPTLLIVGGDDTEVLALNRSAFDLLKCEKELVVVHGATHLFEETGALERVANLAASWFKRFLTS